MRMPSSSIRLPCSIDATPAATARLIASVPCACAATLRPHIAASSQIAFISSREYCGAPTDSSSERTPADAIIFMTSAPYFTFWRTSLRTASTPSATPEKRSNFKYGEKPVRSPWPPVEPIERPATFNRGPNTLPASIAFRSATSTYSGEPTTRSVVNPASIVLRA